MKRRWNGQWVKGKANTHGGDRRGLDVLNEPDFKRKSEYFTDDYKTAQKRARYVPDNPYMVMLRNLKENAELI